MEFIKTKPSEDDVFDENGIARVGSLSKYIELMEALDADSDEVDVDNQFIKPLEYIFR